MAKIKVSIVDSSTLKLEEKGDIGDTIDLKELKAVDDTLILDSIHHRKDEIYNHLLKQEVQQQEANKKIALTELENKLRIEIEKLKRKRPSSFNSSKPNSHKPIMLKL